MAKHNNAVTTTSAPATEQASSDQATNLPAGDQVEKGGIVGEVLEPLPAIRPKGEREHKATFASDNRVGGYMIRVEGPNSDKFAKREIPVTRYDDSETMVKLEKLIWSGPDKETGKKVTLYKFVANPRAAKDNAVSF